MDREKWGVEDVLDKCDIVIETDDKKPSEIANIVLNEYKKFLSNKKRRLGEFKNERKRIIY